MLRQASDGGQLYGSVNARDIAAAVTEAGFTIERKQVVLDDAIKTVGLHLVRLMLHPEVVVTVTVNVARSEVEAASQAEAAEPFFEKPEEALAAEAKRAEEEASEEAAPAVEDGAEAPTAGAQKTEG